MAVQRLHPRARREAFGAVAACALVLAQDVTAAKPGGGGKPPEVQIAGLQDMNLGSWWGIGALEGVTPHCVYSSDTGLYSVVASGDGPGGAFELIGDSSNVPYEAWYNDGSGWMQLSAGLPLSGRLGHDSGGQFAKCLDGRVPPSQVRVTISQEALEASLAGTYNGQLQLLISPE